MTSKEKISLLEQQQTRRNEKHSAALIAAAASGPDEHAALNATHQANVWESHEGPHDVGVSLWYGSMVYLVVYDQQLCLYLWQCGWRWRSLRPQQCLWQ